jgi:hypothetical protein
MEELLGRLESDCARLGILLATAASGDVAGARELVRRGYQMVAMSSDVGLLWSAMADLRSSRPSAASTTSHDLSQAPPLTRKGRSS